VVVNTPVPSEPVVQKVAKESPKVAGIVPSAEDMVLLNNIVSELDTFVETMSLNQSVGAEPAQNNESGALYTSILIDDRDTVIRTVATADKLIKNTTSHLTHIMEALSFQDLSGQRIKKIVDLIGDIQVQLLSLLVSIDSKIKAHQDTQTTPRPKEETEKVAQAEVDKMLEKLSGEHSELNGPGAENRLNQGAVNDLLAELGF
jgi:chemotaxis protein CheZ